MILLEFTKMYISWPHVGALLFCEDNMLAFRSPVFLSLPLLAQQQVGYMTFHFNSHPQQRARVFFVQGDITNSPSVNQPALP